MSSTDTYAYSSDNNDTEEYVDLIGYDNYEILTTEPFTIRRKDNKLIVSEHIENNGYLRLMLRTTNGQVTKLKHRLIAEQFLPNPNNLPEVDHIDRDKLNNSLNNLRWVSRSDNNRNRTVSSFGKRQYLNHAPNDITEILLFNNVQYNHNTYYFCYEDDCVYKKFNDHKWQKLKQAPHCGYLRVTLFDTNRRKHNIYMHKLIKHFRTQKTEQVNE